MPFVIEHDGISSEFADDSLLIFIDETGHEDFADPGAPFFGFGGCLCAAGDYDDMIERPWHKVEALFPPEKLPLHAAELRPQRLSTEQIAGITAFFEKGSFGRFASIAKADFENETPFEMLNIMAEQTYARILEVIKESKKDYPTLIFIIEHSERLDAQYADYFRRYHMSRKDGTRVPAFHCTQSKSSGEHFARGLVAADFIAHTAGSMSRSSQGGKRKASRRDFNAVFQHPLASHLFLDAARN